MKTTMNSKEVKKITFGQVKKIALEASKKWELVNHGSYYNVINIKTRQCSIEGGRTNLVSYNFETFIEYLYIQMIGENGLYFDFMENGVECTNDRKNYVLKIKYEVVRLLCGFELKNNKI